MATLSRYSSSRDGPEDVADKVLRRAKVSKMTRALQDRLALANIKIQHGRNSLSVDVIPKRRRTDSNADVLSDTASSTSGRCFSAGMPSSSPLTGPIFSDPVVRSGSSHGSVKRTRTEPSYIHPSMTQRRPKARSTRTASANWKKSYQLPESSPIRTQQRPSIRSMHNHSFVSETSTILDSPSASEDDDQDLPLHSFQMQMYSDSNIPSSPPRTPSPDLSRSAQLGGKPFSPLSGAEFGGKEGADLLLYLAASPSPAMHMNKTSSSQQIPSTPPSSRTPLPSSLMNTPGNQLWGFGATTPNTAGFNFAEFCNVTPSPAQRRWPATPAAKTPHTARARRDGGGGGGGVGLMPPPSASPMPPRTPATRTTGLGMELGGELVRK